MAARGISEQVLSEALHKAISGRRVVACVFLTFQFDPGFFEEEILPLLFDQSFSHVAKIRLLQLEEALLGVKQLAVYYDRRGLAPDARAARLDYARIGLARSTGYFHPKNILLLLENEDDAGPVWHSLLTVTTSANLTRSGWWENVEVAHYEEVHTGEKCSFRRDLLDMIRRVKAHDRTGAKHEALESIRTFVRDELWDASQLRKGGRWKPRLYTGRQSVPDFLRQYVPASDIYNLEILSPYFDESESAGALVELVEAVRPKETRVYLPRRADGAALCRDAYFAAVAIMPYVRWGALPPDLVRQSGADKQAAERFVHAKVYRLWSEVERREIFFIGSPNLTYAAHQAGRGGNYETGMLVEKASDGRLTWWLSPLDVEPSDFRPELSEDEAEPGEPPANVTFRFDWAKRRLDYFWESGGEGSVPENAAVSAQGSPGYVINRVRADAWIKLPAEAVDITARWLPSTSIIEVRADAAEPFRVLVRETGMAHKPSILLELTAEEILQYWALLSPEQREHFLEERAALIAFDPELVTGTRLLQKIDTMFDRFAGIIHAFSRFEQQIHAALDNDLDAEADYRLFGKRYDALPALLDQIDPASHDDRVNHYVTANCAALLVRRLGDKYPDYTKRRRTDRRRLERQVAQILDDVRAGFAFAPADKRDQFFEWFDEMFMLDMALSEPAQ